MTESARTEPHTHCWHTPNLTFSTGYHYPPRREEVCCHCGARQSVEIPQPPIPDGHGKYYPRPFGNPMTLPFWSTHVTAGSMPDDPTRNCKCRPENGGSGVCGCIISGPVVR